MPEIEVLIEQTHGDPKATAAEYHGDKTPPREVYIAGQRHEHVSEDAEGRWVYRAS